MREWRLFCGSRWDGGWWFRICGFGIRCADRSKHRALFSERNGLVKVLRIGRWSFRFLTPGKGG